MKHIKVFNSQTEYNTFKNGSEFSLPNLSVIKNGDIVYYNPFVMPPPKVGDIFYYNASKEISYVDYNNWTSSLGTPIGVVVIPPDFLPDKLLRIMTYKPVNELPELTSSTEGLPWCTSSVDTPLINCNRIPTTDNAGSTSAGSGDVSAYIPTDSNTGTTSYVDSKAKYYGSPYIPSPYKVTGNTEILNTEFNKKLSGYNNPCSDFDGFSNTQKLAVLRNDTATYGEFVAANAAWFYNEGISKMVWYLPSVGEAAVAIARVGIINKAIAKINGLQLTSSYNIWSSNEYSATNAIRLNYLGTISKNGGTKTSLNLVYPFAIIDNY